MKKQLFLTALGAAALSLAAAWAGVFVNAENLTLDMRFRLYPDPSSASDSIVIIAVDQASLESMDWLGWPWPRQIWSDLTGFLQESGARVVYYDITFPTSSTFSATEDSVFGATASRGSTVFITALGRSGGVAVPPSAVIDIASPPGGEPYTFATPPVPPIAAGAAILAAPYAEPDEDGIFRKSTLFFPVEDGAVPSPALACAMLFTEDMEPALSGNTLELAGRRFSLNNSGELQVRFAGPAGTYTTLGISEVFAMMTGDPEAGSPEVFEGRIVMIGYASADLMDLKPMPYTARCPGVEVIANTAGNLLTGNYLRTSGFRFTALMTVLLAMAAAATLAFGKRVVISSLAGFLILAVFAGASLLVFRHYDLWIEVTPPLTAGFLTLLAGSVTAYRYATREKRFLRAAFSQYLSPEVVSRVAANPETLKLGGEKRTMTAFFSDVAGFTSISEKLDPSDLVSLLNTYLTEMTDVILESGGTVDKFEGDAIIAFWGAPVEYSDHALRGVRAALECQRRHEALNRALAESGFPELHTRIGLASGPMVVGNMGSTKRFDYTIMGSDVNLASRLEGVNKVYGTSILIAEKTRTGLPGEILCREVDTVLVVGQKVPVTIYEPLQSWKDIHDIYIRGLALYRAGEFKEALEVFAGGGDDPPCGVMAERCRTFITEGAPADWRGVWELSSK